MSSPFSEIKVQTGPVRDAATLVLLRDGAGGVEVLMVRRQRAASFMADAFVFPGGRTEPDDGGDFALSAAREAFEEAGVLLAVDEAGAPARTRDAAWVEEARRAVHKGDKRFGALLAEQGLRVDTSGCRYFARWVTPSTEPRRFDARFFLARMPPDQDARPDASGEVVDFRWDRPQGFLAMHDRGEIKLPPPTLWHLADLTRFATVDDALAWAKRDEVIVVRPKLWAFDGAITIVLPWDRDYAGIDVPESAPLSPDSPVAGPITRYVLEDGLWIGKQVR